MLGERSGAGRYELGDSLVSRRRGAEAGGCQSSLQCRFTRRLGAGPILPDLPASKAPPRQRSGPAALVQKEAPDEPEQE